MTNNWIEEAAANDPTTNFLSLCLRARFDQASLVNARRYLEHETIDWDLLANRIRQEALASLIYGIVGKQDLVPPDLEKWLHQEFVQRATAITYLSYELEQIANRLSAAGIKMVILKGAALAKTVYTPDFPRYFSDLDLLVHGEDVNRTISTLSELGYKSEQNAQLGMQDFLPYVNEWQLQKQGHLDVEIDLHWHLFEWNYYQHNIALDWFWQTALPVSIGSNQALVLGPEAQIMHLSVHLLQHRGQSWDQSWRLLHDVAEVINYYGKDMDWELLLGKIVDYNIVLPVRQVILHVGAEWQVSIPQGAMEKLEQLRPSAAEEQAFALLNSLDGRSDARFAVVSLANLPSWQARLRYLFGNLLFPPTAYMRHRYQIRKPYLLPLYYPYRWYLGLISAFNR